MGQCDKSMNSVDPTIVVTGEFADEVFQWALADDCDRLHFVATTELIRRNDIGGQLEASPDLIVLCQSRRGSLSPQTSESIIRQFPLAQRLVLLGSECEGERRSGTPLIGWHRRFWYQWSGFATLLNHAFQQGSVHPMTLPSEATDSDLLISLENIAKLDLAKDLRISMDCRWNSERELFTDLWSDAGWSVAENIDEADVVAVIRDSLDEETQRQLLSIRQIEPAKPLLLSLNFPRIQEAQLAKQLGASALIGRPFVNLELLVSVQRMISHCWPVVK